MTSISAVIFLTSPRFDMATVNIVGRAEVGEYGYAIGVRVGADRADGACRAADPRTRRPTARVGTAGAGRRARESAWRASPARRTSPKPRRPPAISQRPTSILEGDGRGPPLVDRANEVVELARVRLGIALDEEPQQRILANAVGRRSASSVRRLVVARDQHTSFRRTPRSAGRSRRPRGSSN